MKTKHLCYSCENVRLINPYGTGRHYTECKIKKDNGFRDIYKCNFFIKKLGDE